MPSSDTGGGARSLASRSSDDHSDEIVDGRSLIKTCRISSLSRSMSSPVARCDFVPY